MNQIEVPRRYIALSAISLAILIFCTQCTEKKGSSLSERENYGGFNSREDWGEHLVIVSACHDCHTPKKMGPMGMVLDSIRLLAGHINGSPEPVINKKEIQSKNLVVTDDLTTWIGPWGTSYTANLTSDATGIGNWTEAQFTTAIRKGKFKGMEEGRMLLPPMPWEMYRNFTDGEIGAIFAYLKSTTPIENVVPGPLPPETK
jgi:hypothetical protein